MRDPAIDPHVSDAGSEFAGRSEDGPDDPSGLTDLPTRGMPARGAPARDLPAHDLDGWQQTAAASNPLERPWIARTRQRRWQSALGAAASWCITLAITLFIFSTATVLLIGPPETLLKRAGLTSQQPSAQTAGRHQAPATVAAGATSESQQSRMAFSGDQVRKVSTVEVTSSSGDSGL